MSKLSTCPSCGKRFTPWRGKLYCGDACSKRAANARARGLSRDENTLQATMVAASEKPTSQPQQNQGLTRAMSTHGQPLWTACNTVTQKLTREGSPTAIAWAMLVEGHGWFGRIGPPSEWSFGPTSLSRAKAAVEARLHGQDFAKVDDERSFSHSCWRLISGSVAPDEMALAA